MVIGALIGIVLGIGIGIILPIIRNRLKPIEKVELSKEELDAKEREKEKQKELRKNFDELMNYDYSTALKRGDK